jgi:hypothetical protein
LSVPHHIGEHETTLGIGIEDLDRLAGGGPDDIARTLGGYPDTDTAVCTGIDRYGLDLKVSTPRGDAYTRAGFGRALNSVAELRSAAADLVHQARR